MLHLALLTVSVLALAAAGARSACALADSLSARVLGTSAVAAGLAVAESLLLGLLGRGTSEWVLTVAALLSWLVAMIVLPAPIHPMRHQLADRWASYGGLSRACIGAVTTLGIFVTAYQMWRPTYGGDGLIYHSSQPAIWLHEGHPGRLHQTLADIPTQAYPKTMEVLAGWAYSIGHTPIAAVPITFGLVALAVGAVVVGLRRLGVASLVAVLAAVAGLMLPANVRELSGVFTDVPALAWLACSVALAAMSEEEPGAFGLAAIAGGLAIGTKPTAAPLVLGGLAYSAWVNRDWIRSHLSGLLPAGLLALGLGGVWYVVDWHTYGSPLWPFSTFPSGHPVPLIWRVYGVRFLHDPVTTVNALGWHSIVSNLGGTVILLPAILAVALVSLLPVARSVRRTAVVGSLVTAVVFLLWASSEFTGIVNGNVTLVFTALRYLVPAPLVAACVLALLSREKSVFRIPAFLVLVAALVVDIIEVHGAAYSFPYRPNLPRVVAIGLAGAVAGLLVMHLGVLRRHLRARWLMPSATVAFGAVMITPASGWIDNYVLVEQRHPFPDVSVISYLSGQPAWRDG
ncbi:MAG: hypothetical protein JO246_14285, partial [Frankiaceae bacterium]|nr:hypothetical protein [Frankiaceae bacterium]